MLLDKSHLGWGIGTAVAFLLALAAYVFYISLETTVSGGSTFGLFFGTMALVCISLAGLLAVRKAFPVLRVGSAQFWLRGHIWLGLLSAPLTLFHTNFRFGGSLEKALMICYAIVMLSGMYGLVLQQFLPRFIKLRVSREASPSQIPYYCRQLQADGDALVAEFTHRILPQAAVRPPQEKSGPTAARSQPRAPRSKKSNATASKRAEMPALSTTTSTSAAVTQHVAKKATTKVLDDDSRPESSRVDPSYKLLLVFYETDVRPFFDGDSTVAKRYKLVAEASARQRFRQVANALPPEAIPVLNRLEGMCDERRQFVLQLRIHKWLHGWLFVHIPLSAALFLLLTAHVIMALRVVPWSF